MTLLGILRRVPRSCQYRSTIIDCLSKIPYDLSAFFDTLLILDDTEGFVDLSLQEKSSWSTLTITAFAGGYCCYRLFGVVVWGVVKCTLPPMLYRWVL